MPRAAWSPSSLLAEPWDAAPRSWRSFWAVKLAAAVVENSPEAVAVRPVEVSGLEWPPSLEEARKRAQTNAVLFRQNYAICGLACLAFASLRQPALLAGLAALAASVIASSDRLLGEAALATDGRLLWNAKRVAGLDRRVLRVGGAALFACSLLVAPPATARWLASALSTALCIALVHMVMRPIDLEAVVGSFWGDLTSSKSRHVAACVPVWLLRFLD